MTTLATTNDHASSSLGNPYDEGCPTRHILDRIGDRWTVLIIGALGAGTLRFNESAPPRRGISQKMLTQTAAVRSGTGIVATTHPEVPVRVEYRLTESGESLRGLPAPWRSGPSSTWAACWPTRKRYDRRSIDT